MIIYQNIKSGFLQDLHERNIEDVVQAAFQARAGRKVSPEEVRSWANSLQYMGRVLMDQGIPPDCGVAIEYTIPQTAKRVDFLLTGRTEEGRDCLVIVELKQWDSAKKTEKDAIVSTRFAQGSAEVNHPSYQAWTYAALLQNFNEAVYDGGIRLKPCAYLHNFPTPGGAICDAFYDDHLRRAPVFLKGDAERNRLQDFIKRHLKHGDNAEALVRIEGGRIRPSKSLADALAGLLAGNPEFVLIDEQKLVYEAALTNARKARTAQKRVLIVEGGPGTGKSVVAVNLLVALTREGMLAKYVTKNAAPRAVYESRLTGTMKKSHISNLFTGSGAFTESQPDVFDALVVDEAHRLNEKSGLYGNMGEHQVKELINSARFCVFFVDESQKVTLQDVGDKDTIRHWAEKHGAVVEEMNLSSQFRCNGSDGYLAWLDHTLGIRETANTTLDASEFDFRVVDSPVELRRLILERNRERNRARMVAGYCWPWNSKSDPDAYDIEMPDHSFRARWNLTKDGGLWMVSPDSVEEVGCIHTCQGLEVDYIGVIIGDDFVVRNGEVVTRAEKRASSDKSIKGWKKMARTNPNEARAVTAAIIKNTYRTLLTRGMRGCYVHFTDPETAAYFRSRLTNIGTGVPATSERAKPSAPSILPNIPNLGSLSVLPREMAHGRVRCVPVVPLKFAAGKFSSVQTMEESSEHWVELPEGLVAGTGMFVAQVVGESMNKRIPSGSWSLFRFGSSGSREGKIVLVQYRDASDPETGGSYTVKRYRSEKVGTDGEWRHARIMLEPFSSDPDFQPVVLNPEDEGSVRVVAEWIAVIA